GGEETVASCVVFGPDGPLKSDYRRFNIGGITAGDDYAALKQALTRRYSRLKRDEAPMPDVLFIDGGRGQLKPAENVLRELALVGHRARRRRRATASPLEEIPGLGPKRRRDLLKQFGGLQAVARAGVDDLTKVKGISRQLAESIYQHFHVE